MVRKFSKECLFFQADVSKPGDVQALLEEAVRIFGKVDIAINNAGIESSASFTADCTEENWDKTMAVNLKGVWLCLKSEIQQMLKQGHGGAIVNMASIAGLVGFKGIPAYVASKHGVVGLTKAAALEYARKGIRINAVCPGGIDTPLLDRTLSQLSAPKKTDPGPTTETLLLQQKSSLGSEHPIGRLGTPEEVASAVLWLCSDAASFVTGHALAVDGGYVSR